MTIAMPRLPFDELASSVDANWLRRHLGSTIAIDEKAAPLLVFRGEHGLSEGLVHSRTPFAIAFGSEYAARRYALEPNNSHDVAQAPRILAVYIRIERPAFYNAEDCFMEFGQVEQVLGYEAAVAIARRMEAHVYHTNNWQEGLALEFTSLDDLISRAPERLKDVFFDAYPVFDDKDCVQMFLDAGYDGAIHMGNGETFGELEYRVFDQTQILPLASACARTGLLLRSFLDEAGPRSHDSVEEGEPLAERAPLPQPTAY